MADLPSEEHTQLQINAWESRMLHDVRLRAEEIMALCAMARRGAGATPPAPPEIAGALMGATNQNLEAVSVQIDPGFRQIWIKGARVPA